MDLEAIMGVNNSLASAFSVYVRNELAKSYQVLSLEDMKAVSGWVEARLKVGCDDTKCLIELGGAMGTDLVVAGSISKIANTCGITLRLINTRGKDAGVSKRVSGKCNFENELIPTIKEVGWRGLKSLVLR